MLSFQELTLGTRRRVGVVTELSSLPWVLIIAGFLLGRSVFLGELLPLAAAFVALLRAGHSRRPWLPFLAVGAGLYSVGEGWPYLALYLSLWILGSGPNRWRQRRRFWSMAIFIGHLLVKAPLAFLLSGSYDAWLIALVEGFLAVAVFEVCFPFYEPSKKSGAADLPVFLLLLAGIVSVPILVFGVNLRLLLAAYVLFLSAVVGGITVAPIIGTGLGLLLLLLGDAYATVVLLCVLGFVSGALARVPGGVLLGAVAAWLVTQVGDFSPHDVYVLLTLLLAAALALAGPADWLRRVGRMVPGTGIARARQEGYQARVQQLLRQRLLGFAQVIEELDSFLGVEYRDHPFLTKQLAGVSSVVKGLLQEFDTDVALAEQVEEKLWRRLDCRRLQQLTVLQSRDGYEVHGTQLGGDEFVQEAAAVCTELFGQEYGVESQDGSEFIVGPKKRYTLQVRTARLAHDGICGDSQAVFPLSSCKTALVLSDGMGVGRQAAAESRSAIGLLQSMIQAGYQWQAAVSLVNQALLLGHRESFTTLDLVVADLNSGALEFIKIGSAASFITTGDAVACISNQALPAGILQNIDVEPERRTLHEGEVLVMTTDGLLDGDKEMVDRQAWFAQQLAQAWDQVAFEQLAEELLARSLVAAGGQPGDDMMVLVARLAKDEGEIEPYRR